MTTKDLHIDEATIIKYASEISGSYADGPDGIPAVVIKMCCPVLAPILKHIFNLSLITGVFPSMWKLSTITPLHKKGKRGDVINYRPIANLSCIGKLFESIVCDVMQFHCKNIIGPFQHGFTKGRSTTTNLLEFSAYCIPSIEAGYQVDSIMTDFSKAFDRLNHNLLISKLSRLGFPQQFVNWLTSYLVNRSQKVLFRNVLSSEIANTSGVPQGSHLGPLLFILFINDVGTILSDSSLLIYADDAKIFRAVQSPDDCQLLQDDLSRFHSWCESNGMSLNVGKCSTITFTRKKSPIVANYTVGGSILSRVSKIKDLGVIFNSQFSFGDHLEYVVNKANAMLGFVKRWSKEFNDLHVTKTLYCTFVRSIMEYASQVWDPFCDVHIRRIESVQRRFLRFALRGLPWNNPLMLPPYEDRLRLLPLESLESRRRNSKIVFVFKILSGVVESPSLLGNFGFSIPTRSTRNYSPLHLRSHRTNYGYNEPITSMSRLFNASYYNIDFNLSVSQVKARFAFH